MRALMNTLAACYGRQMNIQPAAAAIVRKDVEGKLTEAQGRLLGERLVRKYKFCPSAAEILAEWHDMRRQERRQACFTAPPLVMHPDAARRARAVRDAVRRGAPLPEKALSPEVKAFARRFFPGITDESIRRNWLAIVNCRDDRLEQQRRGSPYGTVMTMGADGIIDLVMARRP